MIAERHVCVGCSRAFAPSRSDAKYCSDACRQRAHRRRHRGDVHVAGVELVDVVWQLRATGAIDGVDALCLLVAPPARALGLLEAAA